MAKSKKVQYIEVENRNPFGEDVDERVFNDPTFTSNYIPGWSNIRHENELRKSRGEEIIPLKHRFHWALAKDLKNTDMDNGRRVQHWIQNKYEVAQYDDLDKMGYPVKENLAISRSPDGKAVWGEHVLVVAGAEVAAAHYQANEAAIEAQEEEPSFIMDRAVEKFNKSDVAQRGGMKATAFEMVEESPRD